MTMSVGGAGATAVAGQTLEMHRSSSMPVKPKPIETKPLARSPEKETVDDQEVDYYPESPSFVRRRKSKSAVDQLETRSEQNFPYTTDWAGSTIELSPQASSSGEGLRRTIHRVMEKNGHENVVFRRIPEKSWRYIRDFVTTLVRPLLRWVPKQVVKETQVVAKKSEHEHSDIYSITPSIQRKLDELVNVPPTPPKLCKVKTNERVTFSI